MKQITGRQQEVLDFISSFTKENNYPPTVREIGEHFNISLRAVQDHIAALQKKGFLAQTCALTQCYQWSKRLVFAFCQQSSSFGYCCRRQASFERRKP